MKASKNIIIPTWVGASVIAVLMLSLTGQAAAFIGTFTYTGSMARNRPSATLLPNGKVLVAGGDGGLTATPAELYDPNTGLFSATGIMVFRQDRGFTATLLPNGKVLLAGGGGFDQSWISFAELYDPATGLFAATGNMTISRLMHTATLLPNGKVLITGGDSLDGVLASAELYDPNTGLFSSTGDMAFRRVSHTATLLVNGKVLVTGGVIPSLATSPTIGEVYDPATGLFSSTAGGMSANRLTHTATLLPNAKVLVAGGFRNDGFTTVYLASAEVYDPIAGVFASAGDMTSPRSGHTATLVRNEVVVLSGGYNGSSGNTASAELYDPATGAFSSTGSMGTARAGHSGTHLPNDQMLVAGGNSDASAELFTLSCPPPPPTLVINTRSSVCALSTGNTASVAVFSGATYSWGIVNGTIDSGQGTNAITYSAASTSPVRVSVLVTPTTGCPLTGSAFVTMDPTCGGFFTVTPCRVLDTRRPDGPYGGPAITANQGNRQLAIGGQCGVPTDARAVVMNVTVTQPTGDGYLVVFEGGDHFPTISTLNFRQGQTRANNAIIAPDMGGALGISCGMSGSGTVHVIIDVNGYFR